VCCVCVGGYKYRRVITRDAIDEAIEILTALLPFMCFVGAVFTWLQLMFNDALWGAPAHNLHKHAMT
jgi:hypothetical protein